MKKLLRKDQVVLERVGFPNCFISFSSEKHVFIIIGILFFFFCLVSKFFSLKTSNILENKSQVFERSDCTITVHNNLYYNELKI